MGEEETVTGVVEAAASGTATPEEKGEDAPLEEKQEMDGVKEIEEDGKDDETVGAEKMDVDAEVPEGNGNKEVKEEEKKEENGSIKEEEEKEGGMSSELVEGEADAKEKEENKETIGKRVTELEKGEERAKESEQEQWSRKNRGRGKTKQVKAKVDRKEVEKEEQKTPATAAVERPVRERKSVERLVALISKGSVKEFHIEKGHGTALKDIPNVAYKISKRKVDDTFKLLHTILFGRRGKAGEVKTNISLFSGFVWNENEEKQKFKVREKFDKCVKEKLLEFCEMLDIPIPKATTTRKEDIVAKLIDFLVAPHATTAELLAEKEQSSKGKKRKRVVKGNALSGSTPSKHSAKSRRKIENASIDREGNGSPEPEGRTSDEEGLEENVNGAFERSKNEVLEHSESEQSKDKSEEETGLDKSSSKKVLAKKASSAKSKTKKVATPKKSSLSAKRTPVKSSSDHLKVNDSSDTKPKTFSRKKNNVVKEKLSTPKKPASSEKAGKRVMKGKSKPKDDKLRPSDDELKNAICEILKEVDFNTATFTDILKHLAVRFKMDLTPRKSSIKLMVQDELTKLADEANDEEDETDAEQDEK